MYIENASALFALIDCNNFFVSCERAFNPRLIKKPVVVLSNNDGCVIARSEEAKSLDIPMACPFYKIKNLCVNEGVAVFSSNFELYGDMSNRIMRILSDLCPEMEVYSIDEAFLKLDSLYLTKVETFLKIIKERIPQWTGIPVSIGVGPTKTLAKVATEIAKKQGGLMILTKKNTPDILEGFPVENIWGIGRRGHAKLKSMGITKASQLREMDITFARKCFSVVGERIILELRGLSCLDLTEIQPRKSLISSCSFGRPIVTFDEIAEAVSCHTAKAATRLRSQDSQAQCLTVQISTSRHRPYETYYKGSKTVMLANPTFDTKTLILAAKKVLESIFKPGESYRKAGIILSSLSSQKVIQNTLFPIPSPEPSIQPLLKAIDGINQKWGNHTIIYGAQGLERSWQTKTSHRSPRYTTCFQELLKVG
jgi:DNA polymerase V